MSNIFSVHVLVRGDRNDGSPRIRQAPILSTYANRAEAIIYSVAGHRYAASLYTREGGSVNSVTVARKRAYFCLHAALPVTSRPDDSPVGPVQLFKVSPCHSRENGRGGMVCNGAPPCVPEWKHVSLLPFPRPPGYRRVQFLPRHCRAPRILIKSLSISLGEERREKKVKSIDGRRWRKRGREVRFACFLHLRGRRLCLV